jgi:hypothetical protein
MASINFNDYDEFIKYLEKTNPKKKPMTIERLRTYPGCENYTDEEAEDILKLLHKLAAIIIEDTAYKASQKSKETK